MHTEQVICGPNARCGGAIIQTVGLNLEEGKISLRNVCELARNSCEVGDHRTVMGFGPGVPLKVDAVTSSDWDAAQAWSGSLMAGALLAHCNDDCGCNGSIPDDVRVCERSWLDVAVVLVVGIPTSSLWLGGFVSPLW